MVNIFEIFLDASGKRFLLATMFTFFKNKSYFIQLFKNKLYFIQFFFLKIFSRKIKSQNLRTK
jgi:hypothetical protein